MSRTTGYGARRSARAAVIAVFSLNGFALASWFVRIPTVQEKLGVGEGALGLALLGAAVGALVSMTVAGALVSRLGSRPVVGATALLLALSLLPLAFAPSLPFLVGALFLLGASNGMLDVSMNAHAVEVERGYARPIMSSFHAAFSFGGLAGAALGGLVAGAGIGILPHFLTVTTLCAVAAAVAYGSLLPATADARDRTGEADGDAEAPAFVRPTRALAGLGIVAFCVLLGEGAVSDWSAVYLAGTLGSGPALAAAGFAAFSLTMALGRLVGDKLTERLGPVTLVRSGGLLAALGLGASLLVAQPLVALLGFACAGAGFSIVFPLALSAAGRTRDTLPGPAIAAVATAGYFGFLVGPPLIGFLAEWTNLGAALYTVVALSAAIALLAGAVATSSAKPR